MEKRARKASQAENSKNKGAEPRNKVILGPYRTTQRFWILF